MPHASFLRPDLGSFCRLDELGLAEGRRVLISDPHRFDGVRVIGVDEHCWRHTRRGDKYVTVIIDLTPIRDGTGPARLLDMVEGRSKQAVAVMDPFHVVRLAGDALDQCRRHVQQATCGHRGRKGDPHYAARRTLHTGSDLLTVNG
jgi:transposase